MEEISKKKSNKGLIAIIIILVILLLGSIGYICYDKGIFDGLLGKDKPVEEPKKEEKLSEEEVMKLHESLILGDTETSLYSTEKISVDNIGDEIITYLLTKYADENNWERKLDEYYKKNEDRNTSESSFNKVASVDKSTIESMIKDEFNVSSSLNINNGQIYGYRAWSISYSANDSMFYLSAGTAGAEYGGMKSKMIKYEQNNDELYIYDKVITCHVSQTFGCHDDSVIVDNNTDYYFVTKEKDSKIKNNSDDYSYEKVVNYDYIFENYGNKIGTYKTTFKKASDGKYYWYSSEIVNE